MQSFDEMSDFFEFNVTVTTDNGILILQNFAYSMPLEMNNAVDNLEENIHEGLALLCDGMISFFSQDLLCDKEVLCDILDQPCKYTTTCDETILTVDMSLTSYFGKNILVTISNPEKDKIQEVTSGTL